MRLEYSKQTWEPDFKSDFKLTVMSALTMEMLRACLSLGSCDIEKSQYIDINIKKIMDNMKYIKLCNEKHNFINFYV